MEVALSTKVVELAVSDIHPYEGAHDTTRAIPVIAASIRKYGLQQPIVIDKSHTIICGNALYKAAVEVGMERVPCLVKDDLTEEQVKQYRIADNKTSEFARWNQKKLSKELTYLGSPLDLQFCFDENLKHALGFEAPVLHKDYKEKTIERKEEAPTEAQVAAKDTAYREQIRSVEKSLEAKSLNYFEYTCSKCGKTVTIKR